MRILDILYPYTCPFCGKVIEKEKGRGACTSCMDQLPYIREPRCMQCGKPVSDENQEYCYDCLHTHHIYDRGLSLWLHQSLAASAIYQFKFHNRRIYSHFFAEQMAEHFGDNIRRWGIQLIVPVPLSRKKRRQRGYNQAELLAKDIGKLMNIPVECKSLVRIRNTKPQKKLDMRARRSNLRHAFAWKNRWRPPACVLLIDDIYTTGNTIDYAAQVLRRAGAQKVYFLTISIGQGY